MSSILLKLPPGGNSTCEAQNVDINRRTYAMLILSHVNENSQCHGNFLMFIYVLLRCKQDENRPKHLSCEYCTKIMMNNITRSL